MSSIQEEKIVSELKQSELFQGVDISPIHCKPIEGGQHNQLYRVVVGDIDVAVRMTIDSKKREDYYSEEFKNQSYAAKAGLAPEILHFNTSNGTIVYPFQKGEILSSDDLINKNIAQKFIATIRMLHKLDVTFDYVYDPIKNLRKRIKRTMGKRVGKENERINQIFPSISNALDILERNSVPKCPCHGDLVLANFIFTNNEPILIDWELSGMGDPQEDLATFLWGANVPIDRLEEFMSLYFEGSDLFHESRTILYLLLVNFYWILLYEKNLIKGTKVAKYERKQTKRLNEAFELLNSSLYEHALNVLDNSD